MLNDAKLKAAKPREKDYRLSDSGQLYVLVTRAGGRHWRMNYTFGRNEKGKPLQKTLSFGSYPAVTLLEARAKREEAKRLLSQGRDPAIARREAEKAEAIKRHNSFQAIAEDWFELQSGWSLERLHAWAKLNGKWSYSQAQSWTVEPLARWSAVHSADVLIKLERDVFPQLGNKPISELKPADILQVLRAVEARGARETAHRDRQIISAIFIHGVASGVCEGDPAASLAKVMKPVPASRPQPSIIDGLDTQEDRIGKLRQLLLDCDGERCRAQTKLALRLLALTAVRPGELAGARWAEFVELEGEQPFWMIPADRMKGQKDRKKAHLVPLPSQAVELLKVLRRLTGRFELCFPSERHAHRPISENTLRALLIRAGYYQRHVPHGFRAAFSTYMNERPAALMQPGDREVIDLMLAHTPKNMHPDDKRGAVSDAEKAYNRAAYMGRRRELAQEWADVLLANFWSAEIFLGEPMRWASSGPGRPHGHR